MLTTLLRQLLAWLPKLWAGYQARQHKQLAALEALAQRHQANARDWQRAFQNLLKENQALELERQAEQARADSAEALLLELKQKAQGIHTDAQHQHAQIEEQPDVDIIRAPLAAAERLNARVIASYGANVPASVRDRFKKPDGHAD